MILLLAGGVSAVAAQEATWIWYPGDFDIWLSNKMQNRRTERGSFFPPFWKLDNHYILINFHKTFNLTAPEDVSVYVEGEYNVKLDTKLLPGKPSQVTLPAGKHVLDMKVFCQDRVPAIYLKGKTLVTDTSWKVTFEDKEWIDATGKVSDQSGTVWLPAASGGFNNPLQPPSAFRLQVTPASAVRKEKLSQGEVLDFGKETFGFIKIHGLKGTGGLSLYYGESREEAMATESCETLDRLELQNAPARDSVLPLSKAFRYVQVNAAAGVSYDSVSMLYEYSTVQEKGNFRCSDEEINRIYDVAKYTLHLNTREFFIDGIKRDRWVWSGDAYQSYLMNYYLYFDEPTVKRTLLAQRGKDPVSSHINTIMDYTFYWFMGIYDYYRYTGDSSFIKQCYPRMQSLMEYCLGRRNKDGLMEGLSGDWIFIDWADGLSKQGEVSFEQLLFCRSLETMALCAEIANDAKHKDTYNQLAADVKTKLFNWYWNTEKQALVHSRINGQPTDHVTRYANMFAIFFNYLNNDQKQGVKKQVLLNNNVPAITTPYMRFYELEALCALGEQNYVLQEMKNYWGGMLKLGATSFWEEYNPAKKGAEHYAMYGRPFGKSLCHAWGASPIYLLGKYYLGVTPVTAGYDTYTITPVLGGLQWMEGDVPVPGGNIHVYCSAKEIKVQSATGTGKLLLNSKTKPVVSNGTAVLKSGQQYEVTIEKNKAYRITYTAL
ncbi:alpha-L-rhamnosidase-related protein [Filimonas lacunae]|nr:amylo-alpha-1,6-glucosidase [Filimonas lacunae]